jgi:hypothetical protein
MRSSDRYVTAAIFLSTLLSACGGSGGYSTPTPIPTPTPTPLPTPVPPPTDQQRTQAATQTAQNNSQCTAIQPFYWEIGDRNTNLAGGTAGGSMPSSVTPMLIASASKWIFGSYVVQLRNGNLTANDISALTMRSGYTNLNYSTCIKLVRANQDAETVHECFTAARLTGGNNNDFNAGAVGKFFYNGGHFQSLADGDLNLGADNNAALKNAIAAQVGLDFSFTYDSPQMAAGVQTTGQDYGFFLRKILSNQLLMHDYLGTNAVCTNPLTCSQALYAPIPSSESWHYSLGHWVEDDPKMGDGAFSSPGAFGFYPWIDSTKTYYGVLARYATVSIGSNDPVAVDSVMCGRTIRKAWMTATAQ